MGSAGVVAAGRRLEACRSFAVSGSVIKMEGGGGKHREAAGKAEQRAGATREERLAMQLRENLKKRKALARAKHQKTGDTDV
jgi:hypothetical protein